MRRRDFLATSTATAFGLMAPSLGRAAASRSKKQLLELRIYHFASPEKQQAFDRFLAQAAVPAYNRAGVKPVGVFKLLAKDNPELKLAADSTDLYVLLPHNSPESFLALADRLASDKTFQKQGQEVLNAPKSDPAYQRYESSVMLAFDGFPKVQVPVKGPNRLLQLRIYESHNKERNRKKVYMFNQGGELGIFRRHGMTAVFFGETLAGSKLPNLTYMLGFDSEEAQKAAWDGFRNDPQWKQMSKSEEYKDAVSNVTNLILRPGESSQI